MIPAVPLIPTEDIPFCFVLSLSRREILLWLSKNASQFASIFSSFISIAIISSRMPDS